MFLNNKFTNIVILNNDIFCTSIKLNILSKLISEFVINIKRNCINNKTYLKLVN